MIKVIEFRTSVIYINPLQNTKHTKYQIYESFSKLFLKIFLNIARSGRPDYITKFLYNTGAGLPNISKNIKLSCADYRKKAIKTENIKCFEEWKSTHI